MSASSYLNARTVPLGNGMPNPFDWEFLKEILFVALILFYVYPPALIVTKLYFLTLTLKTLGMNSTCFWDDSFNVTGSLKVYKW